VEIEFGHVEEYKENGVGGLGRTFKNPENQVWFHITKIKFKYPELAKKLDSGSYSDVKLWYEVDKVNGKKQATQIWLDPQDIPKDKRDELVKHIEEIWSNTSSKSIPRWLDRTTIDLVGQSRRDELFKNRNSILKSPKIVMKAQSRVNDSSADCDLGAKRMSEKYRPSSVGALYSAKKFSDSPKNGRPNAAPLPSDVTSATFQTSSKTPLERIELLKSQPQSSTRMRAGMGRARSIEVSRLGDSNHDGEEQCGVEEEPRENKIERIVESYGLTKVEADELHQLLEKMHPLKFTHSKQLSTYIVKHQLGYEYQYISGILRMREAGEEWDFHGGFPSNIYAIVCKELKLGSQGTPARPVRFTPFKDIY